MSCVSSFFLLFVFRFLLLTLNFFPFLSFLSWSSSLFVFLCVVSYSFISFCTLNLLPFIFLPAFFSRVRFVFLLPLSLFSIPLIPELEVEL